MTKILVFVSSIYSMMIVIILLYCIFLMRSLQYLRIFSKKAKVYNFHITVYSNFWFAYIAYLHSMHTT